MISIKKEEAIIGWLLTLGTIVAAALVIIGGTLFLLKNSNQDMHTAIMQSISNFSNLRNAANAIISFSPLGIVEFGVLTLIATQLLRVALLVWFYTAIRDYKFVAICSFVLLIMIYSFIHPA